MCWSTGGKVFSPCPVTTLLEVSIVKWIFFPKLGGTLTLIFPFMLICWLHPPSWKSFGNVVRKGGKAIESSRGLLSVGVVGVEV